MLVLQNPYDWALDQSLDELVAGWEKPGPGPGEVTRQTYATHTDRAAQLRHVRLWYDTTGPDGVLRRRGAAFSLRWTYQPELELLLERNGFAPKHWYGSYDLEPYDERSPLLIAVASPAQ